MVGEGMVYCLQSRLKGRAGAEGSINAGGCNFNSFLRRTVRFVGTLCHILNRIQGLGGMWGHPGCDSWSMTLPRPWTLHRTHSRGCPRAAPDGMGVTHCPIPAVPRCPRVRALCHSPGDRRHPAGYWLPRSLFPDRLQAKLHTFGHPLRCQPLHHPGHLLRHRQTRHPLCQVCARGALCHTASPPVPSQPRPFSLQEDFPIPACDTLSFRCCLHLGEFPALPGTCQLGAA